MFDTMGATVGNTDGDSWFDLEAAYWNPLIIGTMGTGTRAGRFGNGTLTAGGPILVASGTEPGTQTTANDGYIAGDIRGLSSFATFTGNSSGTLSNGGNYVGSSAPVFSDSTYQTGAALSFGPTSNSTVNFDPGSIYLRGITIASNAPSYTFTGNGFQTIGGIENDSANTATFSNSSNIILDRDQTLDAFGGDIVINSALVLQDSSTPSATIGTYGSHNVTINGNISGGATFWDNPTSAAAILTLGGNNTFTGSFDMFSGVVRKSPEQQRGTG